jgi:formate dehydrogenase subunit gamma
MKGTRQARREEVNKMIIEKGMIKSTDGFERIVHWCLAASCIILIITGLGMMYHSFHFLGTILGGLKNLKFVHNYVGIIFIISLLFAIGMWWKEAGKFELPEDLEWILCAGGYLWHVDNVPEVGKYNPGQKAFFLTVAIGGIIMGITGLIMWFSWGSVELIRWMYPIHALGFVIIFAFFIIHLYLGTIGSPGSAPAMFTGWVRRSWAKKQHPKWLKEMEESGKLEVYGEE